MTTRTLTVLSERLAGHEVGDDVAEEDLGEANVDALIAGGHLEVKTGKAKPDKAEKQEGSE